SVAGAVAVLRAGRDRVGSDEVQTGDAGIGPRREVGRVRAVFEIDLIGPPGRPEPPLLAGVGDVERADRPAGVIRELGSVQWDERPGAQGAEGAVRGGGGAVAVGVSRG